VDGLFAFDVNHDDKPDLISIAPFVVLINTTP
jgi:hypothetical protein